MYRSSLLALLIRLLANNRQPVLYRLSTLPLLSKKQTGNMSHYGYPDRGTPYNNPAPMPKHIPHVDEIGATSAPLKSASFFIGEKCKEFNGQSQFVEISLTNGPRIF
jgi:hypothetical protein